MTDLLSIVQNRKPAQEVLAGLTNTDRNVSVAAGQALVRKAKDAGVSLPDYLRLAIEPAGPHKEAGLDGYEIALATLNLPLQDDFSKGIVMQAAADTFATFPGVRALFPAVIDDVVQWKYRQQEFENVDDMVAQTRTINGTELITQVIIDDNEKDYQVEGMIAEGARIPHRSIRATDKSVRFWKFGSAIEWTYEFSRRASLDMITPYAARMRGEVERAQVAMAYALLANGDGVHAPAPVVAHETIATDFNLAAPTDGKLDWEVFTAWMIRRAQLGTPIDTVVGNWDMYFQWLMMFAKPSISPDRSQASVLADAGVSLAQANPRLNFSVNFVLASAAPAGQLLGYSRQDTMEQLIENASDIEETEKYIENQKVKYFHTVNKGFRLVYGDTREILDITTP
jgi:hypothetical protein